MNSQLAKVNDVLRTDLSAIVQRVSLDQKSMDILTVLSPSVCNNVNESKHHVPPPSQGQASLNDTPHMVIEQTRSVVESKSHFTLPLTNFPLRVTNNS